MAILTCKGCSATKAGPTDGRTVGTSTDHVPNMAANWDIQNEAALNGDRAAPNSSAQMDIAYVKGWSWS